MNNKEKKLIIILTILIIIITTFTIFILITKKQNRTEVTYDLQKEEIIDIAGNITTIPNRNYSFTINNKKITFCFKKEKKCLTTTYKEKNNTIVVGGLKDESLSGTFEKSGTNDDLILEKKLSNGTSIKFYYTKRQG